MAYLDVVVPPQILDEESSGETEIEEGSSVRLRCKATGHPSPNVSWQREGSTKIVLRNLNSKKGIGILKKRVIQSTRGRIFQYQPWKGKFWICPNWSVKKWVKTRYLISSDKEWQLLIFSGPYLCIAKNGIPPSVSKRIMLRVNCIKYSKDKTYENYYILFLQSSPNWKFLYTWSELQSEKTWRFRA